MDKSEAQINTRKISNMIKECNGQNLSNIIKLKKGSVHIKGYAKSISKPIKGKQCN